MNTAPRRTVSAPVEAESLSHYLHRLEACINSLQDFRLSRKARSPLTRASAGPEVSKPSSQSTLKPPLQIHPFVGMQQSRYASLNGTPPTRNPRPRVGWGDPSELVTSRGTTPVPPFRLPNEPPVPPGKQAPTTRPAAPTGPARYSSQDARSDSASYPTPMPSPMRSTTAKPSVLLQSPANKVRVTSSNVAKPILSEQRASSGINGIPTNSTAVKIGGSKGSTVKLVGKAIPRQSKVVRTDVPTTIPSGLDTSTTKQSNVVVESNKGTKENEKSAAKTTSSSQVHETTSTDDIEADLEAKFARLTTSSMSSTPVINIKQAETVLNSSTLPKLDLTLSGDKKAVSVAEAKERRVNPENTTVPNEEINTATDRSPRTKEQLEDEYMQLAFDYLSSLPQGKDKPFKTDIFIHVAKQIRESMASSNASTRVSGEIKQKYVTAVANHLNGLRSNVDNQITSVQVYQILNQNKGDFLNLCATLIGLKVLRIDIDELIDLANAVAEVLDVELGEVEEHSGSEERAKSIGNSLTQGMIATSHSGIAISDQNGKFKADESFAFKAWPDRGTRDNPAQIRTVVLKGVSAVISINQLQSLVWGGRIERFFFTVGDKEARVKFMTAAGCKKYFEATGNGISFRPTKGDKEILIIVEQLGPNSTNDVLQNMIQGDATRCVRAVGADSDWGDKALLVLATKKGKEIEKIINGKTDDMGRFYVEFRFANVYHAMTFAAELKNDMEWEHCNVFYAPDPCEAADGVHIDD